jgi:hypothetical protein
MEAKLYRLVYRMVMGVAHPPRRKGETFSDRTIVLVYLWSVLRDRSVSWACDARNWPAELERELPSDSRMSVRLRTVGVLQLLQRVLEAMWALFDESLVKTIDSKPLLVGAYSHDRDAKRGRIGAGMTARGYRLHAVCIGRAVRYWTLDTLKTHDSQPALELLQRLQGGGYVVADNAYDTNDLHTIAAQRGHQLVAPPKYAQRHVRDMKYNTTQRLRTLDMLASPLTFAGQPGVFGRQLYNLRQRIESGLGELSNYGLNYLPAWVRGPRRVALWTGGKILLHLARDAIRKGLTR